MTPFQRPKLTPLKIKKMVIRSAFVHRATDVSSRGLLEREWAKVLLRRSGSKPLERIGTAMVIPGF